MAGVKISALNPVASALLTDTFPVVQAGVTSKETLQQVATLFNANLSFLPLSGGTMTGAINMGAFGINNLLDPVLAQDAATKNYVDTIAQGITVQGACRVATTGALTVTYANGASGVGATLTNAGAQAAIVIDGVTLALNDRVLVKNQASTFQNGIYIVTTLGSGATNWVLTRSTDYDQVAEINPGDLVVINAGTVNTGSSWLETATVITIGTSAISFSQFTAALPISMANGGTGANLTASVGAIPYSGASAMALLANPAATGKIFQSGNAAAPTWSTATYPSTAGTSGKILISDGTNIISSTPTYPNAAGTSGKILISDGTNIISSTPTYPNAAGTSGNYIKSNGTNFVSSAPTTPTMQTFLSGSGTYTTPAGVLYLRVRMVGGGGGGSGSANGTNDGGTGGTGGTSTFGSSLLTCIGGTGGTYNSLGGAGGTATISAPAYGTALTGGRGTANQSSSGVTATTGHAGAATPFGGEGGGGGPATVAGVAAAANTGSGGGGAGGPSTGGGGSSGGASSYIEAIIPSPNATYAYAIGAAGTAGTAGTSGAAGGAGGSGIIIVTEFYQ